MKAGAPTLRAWWRELMTEPSAELQLPLYMLYVWGWAKLLGASEWSLHAANVPWFVGGAAAFILAFPPGDRRRLIAACVVGFSPFAWYYLDEARPYSMQLGGTLLVMAALARLSPGSHTAERRDGLQVGLLLIGLVVMAGSSLLGMAWAAAGLAVLAVLVPRERLVMLVKHFWFLWLVAGGLLALLGCYYFWTLTLGARASVMATTSWGSVLFAGYELLGCSGLGPGRLEMRSAGPAALHPYWAWLAPYVVAATILIGAALREGRRFRDPKYLIAALCCSVPPAVILGMGRLWHVRILGRHLAPLAAVVWFLFVCGLWVLWSRRSVWTRGVALVFCALSLVSCLSLRFSLRHEKDNYRAAAAAARAALGQGQIVWWNAAAQGARYYGLPLTEQPGSTGAALLVHPATREELEGWPAPGTVITSKPDLYDGQGVLAAYLRERRFKPIGAFPAFVIWERSGPSLRAW